MITTSERDERRGAFTIALVLSLLVNVAAGSLVSYFYHVDRLARLLHLKTDTPREFVATSTAITIERRNVPRPAQRHRPVPPPARPAQPRVAVVPRALAAPERTLPSPVPSPTATARVTAPPVRRVREELAKIRPRHVAMAKTPATAAPERQVETAPPAAATAAPITVPHTTRSRAHGSSHSGSDAFSPQQIAALEGTFRKTIAQAQAADQPIPRATLPPSSTKRWSMQFEGIHGNLRRGEGYIEPISARQIGNTMWYYTHYEYMYPDGTFEEDDIPWPFHYPINNDPFARHDRYINLQSPPAGYVPNRPLKRQLQQFFPNLYPNAVAGGGTG